MDPALGGRVHVHFIFIIGHVEVSLSVKKNVHDEIDAINQERGQRKVMMAH
jgi:hypothetical protein